MLLSLQILTTHADIEFMFETLITNRFRIQRTLHLHHSLVSHLLEAVLIYSFLQPVTAPFPARIVPSLTSAFRDHFYVRLPHFVTQSYEYTELV